MHLHALLLFSTPLTGLLFLVSAWGPLTLVVAVVGVYAIDVLLVVLSAVTWRREEVIGIFGGHP